MYQEIKSRRLALLVAIALTGGSLAGATNAYAAEVTGQNVTINASNQPSNNATDPNGTPGSAAGVINDPANGDNVSGNTLTLENYNYSGKNIFGGFTRGTGCAKNNTVHIRENGKVATAYGGITYGDGDAVGNWVYLHAGGLAESGLIGGVVYRGSGSAEDNHVVVERDSVVNGITVKAIVNNFIRGGNIDDPASTDHVTGNTVKIAGGVIDAPVYGGYNNGSGDVTRNEVTITDGEIHSAVNGGAGHGSGNVTGNTVTITGGEIRGSVYGGTNESPSTTGSVTGNTVTITGGEIRDHVYGGFTNGDGDVTGNIVNIGDGAHDLAAGTRIQKSIYGGSKGGGSGTISGNILHVKASASAQNIHNFDTINFSFTKTLSPKLTLSDTAGTTIKSLSDITVNGFSTIGTSTLIENVNGITVSDGRSSVSTTGDTTETILSTDRTGKKIDYARYIFKGARTAESSIYETWGGHSVIGNTTTGNEITVSSGAHTAVYGGWTTGAGSTAAAENRGDSTYNKVTVDGTATVSGNVDGGMTTVVGGKASHNEVTINGGTLSSGNVYGGSADSGSSADDNKVYLNGIDTPGTVYGGSAGLGTANGNEVHLNGAKVTGSVFGGAGPTSTSKNKVYLNGATVMRSVYGGDATSADENEVHLNGATVTGDVYGGAANGTGNLLSVKGVNSARWIAGFQKVSFDTAGVAAGQHMLTITDTANRTALDWNALTATGTARGIDLIYHEQGIDLSHYTAGSVKSALSTDGKSEYDIEAVDEGGTVKRLAYNSYQFKDARTAETVGGETWGGRSRVGNTTTGNEITVSSGAHTDVYGGCTRGASSQTATADKGNSTDNKVTVDGTATVRGNVYGGMTTVMDGKASHNEVTINGGALNGSGDVYGGSANSGSSADDNKVYLNGISTPGTVYGGSAGHGTANGNEVHLNGATVRGAVFGGDGGSTNKNKVYLLNDAQVTGDVYGGNATSANDNEVHLNGATVTGGVSGGAADGTGNLLSVKGVNSAGWIAGFQKVTFDAAGVAAGATMLNLGAGTTLERDAIDATGSTVSGGITLLHNANGITVNGLGATDNILKSEADETTEKNIAAHRTGSNITDIRYEGYQFAGVTTPVIIGTDAYGGISKAGNSTHDNVITVNGDYTNVYGGHTSGAGTTRDDKDNSYSNTVTITGGTLGNVYGGYTAADGTTNNNTVTLAGGTVTGTVSGGNRTADGNTLNVNTAATVGRIENFEKVTFKDAASKLTLTDTGTFNLNTLEAGFDATVNEATLVESANALTLAGGNVFKSELNADGTKETNLDVRDGNRRIVRYAYTFKGATAATAVGSDTWGGRSVAGNTTAENSVTITGGNHTNIYGGWTTGTGSQAAADKRGDSISNNVTVNGSAAVSGTVYGGYTDVTGGRASNNTVSLGSVTVNQVVGGEGTTTDNNTVNINGTTVTDKIIGGTQAMGTGNTLNVAGTNTAANIVGFQKVAFNMNGVAAHGTMLNLTGGAATKVDWTNLTATGTAVKPLTLLKNDSGIDLVGYTGAAKSETTDTTETNVDVRKNNDGKVTEITYEGYQFARAESASVIGTDAYGGISKAGNATHTNHITVNSDYTNVYGGHTSGTSTTAVEKKNSHDNTVTIKGGTIGNVYGGYTAAADGTTNHNTVTLAGGTVTGTVSGGNRTAQGNKLVVNTNARVGRIENFEKYVFNYKESMAADPMLTLTGGAASMRLDAIEANGTVTETPTTLVHNAAGLTIADYDNKPKSMLNADGTRETNLDVRKTGTLLTDIVRYSSYSLKGTTESTTSGGNTWGGRSSAGNTTAENSVTITGGNHTNIYGGWTTGTGSEAAAERRGDSTSNKVTVNGSAAVSGTVYGGYSDVTGGKATRNEVTVDKAIAGSVVGGQSAGDATGNIVNIKADSGAITGGRSASGEATGNSVTVGNGTVSGNIVGGDGTTTNKNIVSLAQANVTGSITGGSGTTANENTVNIDRTNVAGTITGGAADGTGNTLNVKGQNAAQNIVGFQKVAFNTNGVAAHGTVLNLTGGAQTKVDWTTLTVTGTAEKPLTLLKNESGIDLAGYTGAAKSETTDTAETNVDVRKNNDGKVTEITYEGYQFARAESASVIGTDAYGGISKAGNATHTNHITVNSDYTNVYGGHTSGAGTTKDDRDNSYSNSVTITGGTIGNVYGGYTAADGTTNHNTVTLAGGTVTGTVSGGNRTALGNTLNVNTAARVGRIENFEKVAFKDAASKLTLTDTGTFNLDTLATNFEATANPVTLVESGNALSLAGGKAFKSELNADGTQETDLDVRGGKKIVRYAYTFAGAKAATTVGSDTWGGRSAAGNTTTGNEITLAGGSYTNVYGGRTTGAGSTAAADKRGNSISNKVTVNGTAAVSGIVYGGYTDVTGGRATGNEVTIEKATVGSVVGGYGTTASGNAINLTDATVSGSVTGGRGTITNDNIIRLRNTKVTGTVTGGSGTITNENRTGFRSVTVSSTAASGTGNTLAVYYGTGTTSIGDLGGIQNIHFDLEDAPTDGTAHTLLSLTNAAGEKNLSDIHLAVHRSGATKKLRKGDTFTLVENTTAGGSVSIGDNVTAEGTDGVTRNYTFGIARNADGKLVATVTKAGMNEQAKSLVETRAGASAFLNDGADFLAGAGMSAAQKEAAAAAMTSGGVYGLWAGMGGGSLRHETGSYVDMKGWNLGVGWARENAVKAGTLTFGPFIEYGRGSYDSYLDDGTHGSGKTSYVGVGMMAKLETKANSWIDGALRVGRTKSDYTGLDTSYDTTSTYYAMHVGVGKDFRVREGDTVSAYVRYSYAHTAGASAHLSSGETCDFDAVNSHRLRIGTRYTHGGTAQSQFYAGLAWEYEFGGDARATCDGDSTPSPSLRGGSGLLELGYRFAPKADSRISYDLNLSGWQGKRQGVTGGISVKWAF